MLQRLLRGSFPLRSDLMLSKEGLDARIGVLLRRAGCEDECPSRSTRCRHHIVSSNRAGASHHASYAHRATPGSYTVLF